MLNLIDEPRSPGRGERLRLQKPRGPRLRVLTDCYATLYGSGDSTIDPDVLASDVSCAIRQEEGDSLGNFAGDTVTTHWNAFAELLFLRRGCEKIVG